MTLVIILGIAIVLFLLSFITKRRFGVLGLALTAGVLLSQLWSVGLSAILKGQGLPVEPLSYSTAAQILLILLPAILLLAGGPKYKEKRGAVIGSIAFALLATLFIIGPITRDFSVVGDTSPVFDFIARWQNMLIATGVAFAILDTLALHGPKLPKRGKEKH